MVMEILDSIFYGMVLQNSAAGALFVLFILLFRKMTERLSKGFVRILWILLLAGLLAPPLLHGSLYTLRNLAMAVQVAEVSSRTAEPEEGQAKAGAGALEKHAAQPEESVSDAGLSADGRQIPPAEDNSFFKKSLVFMDSLFPMKSLIRKAGAAVPAIWFAGVVILCAVYLCQFFWLRRKTADAVFLSKESCWAAERADTPFVMPSIPPRIYLPKNLSDSQRADILAHERQHIKNFDPLIKCVAAFAAAVHWFNPLVWAAYLFMGKDLEMYCDERVLRGKCFEERKRYSKTLLEFAAKSSGVTLITRFGESDTEHRIRHILYVKKPRRIVRILLAVLVGAGGIFFLTAKNVDGNANAAENADMAAEQEALLAEKIRVQAGAPLLKQCFADFDGDGTNEMFAVAGAYAAEGTSQIWYAGSQGVTCLMNDAEGYAALWQDEECIYTVNGSQKLFIVTCGTMGGSVLFSKCYYVKSGRAYETDIGAYLEQLDGEDFAVYPDAYDRMCIDGSWSGHTWKAYYLKWTGDGFAEYLAEEISIDALKKYSGSEDVLRRIEESGYEVSSIYLRSNGRIHINVVQDFDEGSGYENVTLEIEDGRVFVLSRADMTRSSLGTRGIIDVSSYGGIYQASGFHAPEGESQTGSSAKEKPLSGGEPMRLAYISVLEGVYYNHVLPELASLGFDERQDISDNWFAVYDIDMDGEDELLIQYLTGSYGDMVEAVYNYKEEIGAVSKAFSQFPDVTHYDNGVIEARSSHNHGWSDSEDFWPYTLYQYRKETDAYEEAGTVDAWDKSWWGDDTSVEHRFPDEMDIDGDGMVYYIMKDGNYDYNVQSNPPMDAEEYNRWRDSYVGGAGKIDVPFRRLTKENINGI